MKKLIIGMSMSLTLACGPELRPGEGAPCNEAESCADGLECYRGFCIPQTRAPVEADDAAAAAPATAVDAGTGTASPDPRDAEPALPVSSGSQEPPARPDDPEDAATVSGPTLDAGAPLAVPGAIAPGATTHDAAASGLDAGSAPPTTTTPPSTTKPPAAPMPNPRPTPSPTVDAGRPLDPGVPRAGCSLQQCCEEALRAANDDDDSDEGKGGKKCGCYDPQLLTGLACGLLYPLGLAL